MLTLYYSPNACSLAPHIALREAGIEPALVRVKGRAPAPKMAGDVEYATITPKNYVPALRLEDGSVLTECVAVLAYAGDLGGGTGLAPAAGTPARYRMYEWLGYINSELHKGFGPFFAPGYSDDQKAAGRAALGRKLDFVQRSLGDGPWLGGGQFTVADAYLFTVLGWLRFIDVDLAQWPALLAYHERAAARPAVQAAMKAEGLVK
jgi:glutathione S-transferase